MLLIFSALVIAAAMSAALLCFADTGWATRHAFVVVIGVLLSISTGIGAIVYVGAAWCWIAAGHQAQIINREYGTDYTQADVFYGRDVIDIIRQLDRKRLEINGDLMRRQGE